MNTNDGRGYLLESWMVYRARPVFRDEREDGSVKYTVSTESIERDLSVTPPPRG